MRRRVRRPMKNPHTWPLVRTMARAVFELAMGVMFMIGCIRDDAAQIALFGTIIILISLDHLERKLVTLVKEIARARCGVHRW